MSDDNAFAPFVASLVMAAAADPPICKRCRHCRVLTSAGRNKYDIECDHNPNLGGVGKTYRKCPGYEEV